MKIIQCLSHFLPERQAGTEIYAWALSKALQKAGHEPIVVIPNLGKSMPHEYEYDGLRVMQYAEPSRVDRQLLNGQRPPDGLQAFASLVGGLLPDIVHFHEYSRGNGITVRHMESVKSLGITTVMTIHLAAYSCRTGSLMYMGRELCDGIISAERCARCYLHDNLAGNRMASLIYHASVPFYKAHINTNRWNNRLGTALGFPFVIDELREGLHRAAAALDGIIVLTDWYKKLLERNGIPRDKLHFIPQGLPYSASEVPRKRMPAQREPITASVTCRKPLLRLVFIGRIDPIKGLHLLLGAIGGIAPGSVELDIYGQATDDAYYRKCLSLSEDRPDVHWKGVVAQEQLIPSLSSYDVLCLAATSAEMSPLVIQEAFAAGIPVIGSDVYGIAEQVKDGINGLLFPYNDTAALRQQIQKLIDRPELLNLLTSNVLPPPSFARVAEETVRVYKDLRPYPLSDEIHTNQ